MKYRLFLDESGEFSEEQQQRSPSIVAGYLVEGEKWDSGRAYNLLSVVKRKRPEFAGVTIKGGHAMEVETYEDYRRNAVFGLMVMEELAKSGIRIVKFANEKGLFFVNSDTTYLTVFTEGLMQLVDYLLAGTSERVELDVLYAHRIFTQTEEVRQQCIRIPQLSYNERISARLTLLRARLPQHYKQRLQINFATAGGTENGMMVTADAVCYALRGGYGHFRGAEKQRIRDLGVLVFTVSGEEAWHRLEEALIAGRLSEAVLLWYRSEPEALDSHRADFERAIGNYMEEMGRARAELELKQVSGYIDALVSGREMAAARRLIGRLRDELLPLLGEGQEVRSFAFDLDFFLLTVATHEGEAAEAAALIAQCDAALARLRPTCETLDYYISYEIRKLEALKNIFDFEAAIMGSEELEHTLCDMEELFGAIRPLRFLGQELRSTNLGKALGSRIQARSQLLGLLPEMADEARGEAQRALVQFEGGEGNGRAYMNLCQIEYFSGRFEAALEALAHAVCPGGDGSATETLAACLSPRFDSFALMHYANIMGLAALAGAPEAADLLKAWQAAGVTKAIAAQGREYPLTTVYWRLATCEAMRKISSARLHYEAAASEMLKNIRALPLYAAGLALLAEAAALLPQREGRSFAAMLGERLPLFLGQELPDSMRRFFEGWDGIASLAAKLLSGEPLSVEEKEAILQKSRQIPVL